MDCTTYLHIGMMKTGTTSLQSFFAQNRDQLGANGFLYPSCPGHKSHIALPCYAQDDNKINDNRARNGIREVVEISGWRQEFAERLSCEIARSCPHTILVSCENLASLLKTEAEVGRLRQLLLPHTERFRVLFYVRRQDHAIEGFYSTQIKNGATHPLVPVPKNMYINRFDYARVYDLWSKVFGEESISVRLFDRLHLVEGDVITDVTSQIASFPEGNWKRPPRENERLGAHGVALLRLLNNTIGPPSGDGQVNLSRGKIGDLVGQFDYSNRIELPFEERKRIYEWFKSSNNRLEKAVGWSLNTIFPPLENTKATTEAEHDPEPDLREAAEIFAKAWQVNERALSATASRYHYLLAARKLDAGKWAEGMAELRRSVILGDATGQAQARLDKLANRDGRER